MTDYTLKEITSNKRILNSWMFLVVLDKDRYRLLMLLYKKVKVAHTRLPSVGFRN